LDGFASGDGSLIVMCTGGPPPSTLPGQEGKNEKKRKKNQKIKKNNKNTNTEIGAQRVR
jgi:hypothetical protein